jgi:hypothetical protein
MIMEEWMAIFSCRIDLIRPLRNGMPTVIITGHVRDDTLLRGSELDHPIVQRSMATSPYFAYTGHLE